MAKRKFTAKELTDYLIKADALQRLNNAETRRLIEESIIRELGEGTEIPLDYAYQAAEQYGVDRVHFERVIELYDFSPEAKMADLERHGAKPNESALDIKVNFITGIYKRELLNQLY